MPDAIGWAATAIFAASYFIRRPAAMRLVQAAAAVCWMVYGFWLHSAPVIVANVVVAMLAVFSAWRVTQSPPPARSEAQTS